MSEYRKYNVKVTESKGKKVIHVTNNYFDKSDYALYGQDKQLTSYSQNAVNFVKRSIKGVEDILKNAKPGHEYVIYTNGVHGEAIRYEDTAVRKIDKTDIFAKVDKHKESMKVTEKEKNHEKKKSNDERS